MFSDVLEIETDIYLCKNNNLSAEPEDIWEGIFEATLAVPSGKLYFTAEMLPEVEILLKPAIYKFCFFIGEADSDNEVQKCRIYFKKTKDQETNDIKILKQSNI